MKKNFPQPNNKKSVDQSEKEILKFWKENEIFEKTLNTRNPLNKFNFFDGPPFATGLPHYGHILAGTIKDAIPRYKTMQGYHIPRKWGWDCHGVPVEFQVEKEHKIGGKPGIEKMGVGKFNELCRSVVMRCADDWENTVDRMGRFVDFKEDYRTMDPEFMESVWWVFGQLWDKGFIYEGEKVIAYSPKLGSPLSNFEANLNYKPISDPALTVKFKLRDEENTYVLAWTTTPWTLPNNLALCVSEKLEYVKVKKDHEYFFVGKNLAEKIFGEDCEIVETFSGKNLVGLPYEALFPFFKETKNAFQVLSDDFVSDSDGTGIVHMAPNFGEEDARVCYANGIKYLDPNPIDENGYFDETISELNGLYFRADDEVAGSKENNANRWVLENLAEKIFKKESITHDYPFCWRTDCALMYRGIKTWFVDVQKIKDQMIEKNQDINWVPNHLKAGRFGKTLETAPDWAISRNRFWGTPIPVWRCGSCGHIEVMNSREILEQKSGQKVDDLHKHFVDDLTWNCEKCSAETEVTFIRHSESETNDSGTWGGTIDAKLTEKGKKQAQDARQNFGEFDIIISSDLNRAIETAQTLFSNAEIIIDDRIREKNYGDLQGLTYDEVFQKYPQFKDNDDVRYGNCPNGESFEDLKSKTSQFIKEIKAQYPAKKIAVVSHGATIRAFHEITGQGSLRGQKFPNLHSFSTILKPQMNRIPEVLDCWFESGSMPYASVHYPFADKENFANFVAQNNFYVARHGEYEGNVKKIYNSDIKNKDEFGLNEQGKQQTQESAEKMDFIPDIIVSSPFRRCRETAKIFAKKFNLSIEIDDRLREINLGNLDGKAERDFSTYSVDHNFETGESLLDIKKRLLESMNEWNDTYKEKNILFVSHGGPLLVLDQWKDGKELSWSACCAANGMVQPLAKIGTIINDVQNLAEFASADFIAEGLDQTRGWFYTLHVLGCALFGKNIFKNVITNGIILAEDGQKMSKSKKNYPDPNLVFEKYGADAMRYYLLNSPVVRGENFRFAENGVAEVLKQIILPLKSSYQFFSTYANIDNWNPTKIQIIRHGEGDHNVQNIYSGNLENAHHLTEKGKEQVRESAKNLMDFDVLISSPFIRTKETANIVKESTSFDGEIIIDERVRETDFGNFEGRKISTGIPRFLNPEFKNGETIPHLHDRMSEFFSEISRDFRGKTITVCGHGDSFREAEMVTNSIPHTKDEWKLIPMPGTAGHKLFFPSPQTDNELDKWILSELQVLVANFRENFDAYALDAALQNIPKFIDKLNNWYLRRSRERFWASGMSDDKISGYETLFQVLLTLSKILAPVCPFFAEELFRNLTGGESVHLEMMPFSNEKMIDNTLNKKIEISREIVRLAAFIRGNKKIKLRQPLAKLQFAIETSEDIALSKSDLGVIRSEANVHEVEIISREILAKYAKRIVKVQAKKVGRKFGKKVQELIINGKQGDFKTLKNGEIEISGEILAVGEYEYGFLTQDGVEAEATSEVVVLLDAEITDELKIEGFSREIIRSIQDLRKSSGFEISDRIKVEFSTESEELKTAFDTFRKKIAGEVLATEIIENSNLDIESIEVGGEKCVLKIAKA